MLLSKYIAISGTKEEQSATQDKAQSEIDGPTQPPNNAEAIDTQPVPTTTLPLQSASFATAISKEPLAQGIRHQK